MLPGFATIIESMARILLLIRHAQTEAQGAGRLIGSTDVHLGERGKTQAKALAPVLSRMLPESCLCSPLSRARETAAIAVSGLALEIEIDPDLREVDFGRWEGLSFEEVSALDPQGAERWAVWDRDFAFPGGEAMESFQERVRRAADRLISTPRQVVLAVTHGGVIRFAICHLLGLTPQQYVLFDVKPASMTVIQLHGRKGVLSGLYTF